MRARVGNATNTRPHGNRDAVCPALHSHRRCRQQQAACEQCPPYPDPRTRHRRAIGQGLSDAEHPEWRRHDHIRHSMTKLTIAAVNDLDLAGGAERLRLVARADRQSEVPSAGVYVTSAVGGMYISRSAIAVPLCSYVCDAVLKVVTSATVGIASLLGRRTRSPGDM